MNSKKWIKVFFVSSVLCIIFIAGINYIIDPLWTYSHSHRFNQIQKDFDERQLKTNYIYNRGLENFDGILLGSSRSTFINQNDFGSMNIYNYSVGNMYPSEYKKYIEFAKEVKGQDFKYIIIGADFFGSNILQNITSKMPEFYIKNTKENLYRYKMLLSFDVFMKSILNIKYSLIGKERYYDRENIKYQKQISEDERIKKFSINIRGHTDSLSNDRYIYNNDYLNILKEIKRDNPKTKFIIFTSAITSDLLVSIIKKGKRIKEYERWLGEIIEVFGEVNHFMTINSVTSNLKNYPDDDHAYPYVLKLLANKLSEKDNQNIPTDFGILINEENINSYFRKFNNEIKNYKLDRNTE